MHCIGALNVDVHSFFGFILLLLFILSVSIQTFLNILKNKSSAVVTTGGDHWSKWPPCVAPQGLGMLFQWWHHCGGNFDVNNPPPGGVHPPNCQWILSRASDQYDPC